MDQLECAFCLKKYPLNLFAPFCPECREPLLYFSLKKKRIFDFDGKTTLEKFLDYLPLRRVEKPLCLGEGNTPLVRLHRLGSQLGLSSLFAKNETVNPTHSFKDRGTAVAVQKASALGIRRIGTVSTGNMASSTAAYGAKGGFETLVLLKEDTGPEKILSTGFHGPLMLKVKGDYGELFRESFRIGRSHRIYFMNSVDPMRLEGYKTSGFEIFLQLEGRSPRIIFVPVSSGGHLIGLIRAFRDLQKDGLIGRIPVFVGVQANGCSPLAHAFAGGKRQFRRASKVKTIAHAISNPDPPGGNLALKLIYEHDGLLLDVTDREILSAQKALAEFEGIFCDPASATTLAGLWKFQKKMSLKPRDPVVLVITGSGLKAMDSLQSHEIPLHKTSLLQMEKAILTLIS